MVLFTMSYNKIMLYIIPTLLAGYIASAHRMVIENRPVDAGIIQRSRQPTSMRIKYRYRTSAHHLP